MPVGMTRRACHDEVRTLTLAGLADVDMYMCYADRLARDSKSISGNTAVLD